MSSGLIFWPIVLLFHNTLHIGFTLLVVVECGGLLLCCMVFRLLAWHSVMETTMVEPVCQGAFTPWHQTWHRAPPPSTLPRLPHSVSLYISYILFSPSVSIPMPFVYFSPSRYSQFQPFFSLTKTSFHLRHLKANKLSTENAKPVTEMTLQSGFLL